MGWSFRIARVYGTEVRLHLTFILFLSWIALAYYMQGGPAAALEGVLFVVLIFLCVVLHEFGHVFAARRFGVSTPDITLLPIGGVARLQRIPEKPFQEFVIAISGPAVNVAIAIVLFAILGHLGGVRELEQMDNPAISMLAKLASFNVVIVLFNLLPAFPMDGGRVLRALLASFTSYGRATRIAAGIGQIMAFFFGFIGLFFNPLLIFIAFFIYLAASQEAALAQMKELAVGVKVSDAMVTHFTSLFPDTPIKDAVEALLRSGQQEFPVVDSSGRFHGILTRSGIIAATKAGSPERTVADLMQRSIPSVPPDTNFFSAFRTMQENHSPALPVVDQQGSLVGLLTPGNIEEMMMIGGIFHEPRSGGQERMNGHRQHI